MADGDGSVVIDVNCDTKEAQKQLNSLTKQIGTLEKQLNTTRAQRDPISERLRTAQKEAAAAYTEIEKLQKALAESEYKTSVNNTSFISADEFNAELEKQVQIKAEIQQQTAYMQAREKEAAKLEEKDAQLVSKEQQITAELERQKNAAGALASTEIQSGTAAMSGLKAATVETNEALSDTGTTGKAAMDKLSDSVSNVTTGFRKSLKTLLKYGLGIRSTYILFRKLRSAIVESFQNLVQYDSVTNQGISGVVSSLATLKNSLATAFAPIVNVVAPILQKFIDMLTTAVNYVAMFFAALSGSSTYTKAVAQNIDYAASLSDAADAASSAADAQDRYLSGLDEIQKFDDGSSSGSGSSGGGSSGSTDVLYEEAEVELGSFTSSLVATIQDVLFEWGDDITAESLLEKVVVGLTTIAGAVIGFSIGGVGGAVIGAVIGLGVGLLIDTVVFDHDGQLQESELWTIFATALTGFLGGIIGFSVGGWVGAAIGATIGIGITLAISAMKQGDQSTILSNYTTKQIMASLVTLAVGGIIGFAVGGWVGALIGATIGVAIGLAVSSLIGDEDSQDAVVTKDELIEDIVTLLGLAVAGGALGFVVGGPGGAVIGMSLGIGLSFFIEAIDWGGLSDNVVQAYDDETGESYSIDAAAEINITGNVGSVTVDTDEIADEVQNQINLAGDVKAVVSVKAQAEIESTLSSLDVFNSLDATLSGDYSIVVGINEEASNSLMTSGWNRIVQNWESTDKDVEYTASATASVSSDIKSINKRFNSASSKSPAQLAVQTEDDAASNAYSDFKSEWNSVSSDGVYITDTLSVSPSSLWNTFQSNWGSTTATTKGVSVKNSLANTALTLWNTFSANWGTRSVDIKNTLKNTPLSLWNTFSSGWGTRNVSIVDSLKNGAYNLWKTWSSNWGTRSVSISNSLASTGSTLWQRFKSQWNSAVGTLKLNIKTPTLTVNWGSVTALGKTFKYPKSFNITWAARGGIVDAATLFGNTVVGEAGKEAIIPLERHTEWIDMVAERICEILQGLNDITGISDGLDRIASAISEFSDKFASMPLPAAASGSVVPPGATASSTTDVAGALNRLYDLLSGNQENTTYQFIGQINRRTLFDEVMTEADLRKQQTGRNPFSV